MRKLALLLLVSIVCSALPAMAQTAHAAMIPCPEGTTGVGNITIGNQVCTSQAKTTYTLEMTGSLYANTIPHAAADVSALVRIDDKMRSYTRMEFRPLVPGQISHSTSTGIEYNLFSSLKLDLNASGTAGIATGPDATGGVFTGGGNLIIKPSWTGGLQFVIAGEMVSSPTLGGSEPQLRFGFRYPLISQ